MVILIQGELRFCEAPDVRFISFGSFLRLGGPPPSLEGRVSASRDLARGSVRDDGWRRELRRDRALGHNRKLEFLRRLLAFKRGVPSHDTLNDVMNALPATLFSDCFAAWVEDLREREPDIVAIDGKTSRRTRSGASHPLHLVSAWATRQRLVLGQEAVAGKGNEITAIPLLLERLELTGALVTIDAIGCQRSIATAIRAKGADYLLALRDNWPALAKEVRLFFDTAPSSAIDTFETVDGDHGRIETRRHRVSHEVGWLATSRRFPGEPRFPDLKAIALVEAEVERDGRTSMARRFYLCSAPLDAKLFARAVRAHWGIENRLH